MDTGTGKKRGRGGNALIIILALIAAAAVAYIIFYAVNAGRGRALNEAARDTAREGKNEAASAPGAEPRSPLPENRPEEPEPEESAAPVDFQALWEINGDICAWLTIPGTDIDYPVVQSAESDDYYLRRGLDGEYLYEGTLFIEGCNSKDFSDFNTVIYGHNMKTDAMFGRLMSYKSEQYINDHPTIIVYTPEKTLEYEIFAVYTRDSEHLLRGRDFSGADARQGYLDEIFETRDMGAYFDREAAPSADGSLITLSTCSGDSRFLVQGALRDD